MSRGRKRLREVQDATKALQPAATKAAGVRIAWRLPDGTVKDMHDIGPHSEPAMQILLDPSTPETRAARETWLGSLRGTDDEYGVTDDLARADATVDAALAAGVDVDPQLVATRRRRGQRPRAIEPTPCDGSDPTHCQGCQDVDALMYSRRQARDRPRVAVGLSFNPLGGRR